VSHHKDYAGAGCLLPNIVTKYIFNEHGNKQHKSSKLNLVENPLWPSVSS